ncbi:MAG: hypothetical protein PVSMB7_29650 [Chloroflexota bacterium]
MEELSRRIMALPSFGSEKTTWTIGMLGTLGLLSYDGWDGYSVPIRMRRAPPVDDADTRTQ